MAGLINELLKAQAQLRLSKLEALIERGAQLFELYILLDAEGVLLLEGGVGFLAAEPMLVPEPLEDPLGCVALLPGTLEVVYQDLVDDGGEGLLLSLSKG